MDIGEFAVECHARVTRFVKSGTGNVTVEPGRAAVGAGVEAANKESDSGYVGSHNEVVRTGHHVVRIGGIHGDGGLVVRGVDGIAVHQNIAAPERETAGAGK